MSLVMDQVGSDSELNVGFALKHLENRGYILGYEQTKAGGWHDKRGIDFMIQILSGEKIITFPLQVKSNERQCEAWDSQPNQSIPVVNGHAENLESQLLYHIDRVSQDGLPKDSYKLFIPTASALNKIREMVKEGELEYRIFERFGLPQGAIAGVKKRYPEVAEALAKSPHAPKPQSISAEWVRGKLQAVAKEILQLQAKRDVYKELLAGLVGDE